MPTNQNAVVYFLTLKPAYFECADHRKYNLKNMIKSIVMSMDWYMTDIQREPAGLKLIEILSNMA